MTVFYKVRRFVYDR